MLIFAELEPNFKKHFLKSLSIDDGLVIDVIDVYRIFWRRFW